MTIENDIRAFVSEIGAVDEGAVVADARLQDDLGIDSLGIFNLAMSISSHCGVELTADDLAEVETVGQLIELVESMTSPGPASSESGR